MIAHVKAYWHLLRGLQRRITAANLSLVAAGGAFFAMLSLFPGMAAVIAFLGFLIDPAVVDDQLALLDGFIPDGAFSLIESQIRRLAATNTSTLGWATAVSTGAALWSARLGTDAVIKAMNAVHGAPMRGGIFSALVALGITLALMLVSVIAVVTMIVLPVALAFLPLGPFAGFALFAGRWLVTIAVILSGIWVLYRFAPNGPAARVRWLNTGAVLALLVWAAASSGFSYYLSNFGSYNEVYGSIGAVIALLMFLYITIFVVLLGAALNAELHLIRVAQEAAAAEETSAQTEDPPASENADPPPIAEPV
ncbi:MAG: YihY/virulence factor BrkB family protein [Rhodobacteraceae bacterium]|nr:YihY/virulence factor BrkB family protein [Paracoccaceae bacterium]